MCFQVCAHVGLCKQHINGMQRAISGYKSLSPTLLKKTHLLTDAYRRCVGLLMFIDSSVFSAIPIQRFTRITITCYTVFKPRSSFSYDQHFAHYSSLVSKAVIKQHNLGKFYKKAFNWVQLTISKIQSMIIKVAHLATERQAANKCGLRTSVMIHRQASTELLA